MVCILCVRNIYDKHTYVHKCVDLFFAGKLVAKNFPAHVALGYSIHGESEGHGGPWKVRFPAHAQCLEPGMCGLRGHPSMTMAQECVGGLLCAQPRVSGGA